jgi:hypothetical protein
MTKKKEDKSFYKYLDETMNKKPKPKPKNKKKSTVEEFMEKKTGKTSEEIHKEYQESMKRFKNRTNQMDRSNPRGIDIKDGGLVLRVTKKGPLYKGKKSGSKKT